MLKFMFGYTKSWCKTTALYLVMYKNKNTEERLAEEEGHHGRGRRSTVDVPKEQLRYLPFVI